MISTHYITIYTYMSCDSFDVEREKYASSLISHKNVSIIFFGQFEGGDKSTEKHSKQLRSFPNEISFEKIAI